MKKLITLIALLFAVEVNAARWFNSPEVPNISCSDGIDNDADGTVDAADADCAAASPFSANGNGYRADVKDAIMTGWTTAADATSSSGTYVKKSNPAGAYWLGEVALHANFTNATYYGWIRYRCSETQCPVWFSTSAIKGTPSNITQAMLMPQAATWTWAQILYTGSNANFRAGNNGGGVRTFALNGNGAIYFKAASGFEIDCMDLDPDAGHTPDCPAAGGGGQPAANYVLLDKGAETAPTAYDSAAFTHANVAVLQGYDQSGGALAITFKGLWDSVSSDIYISAVVPDTQVLNSGSITVDDDADWFNVQHDNFDFRVRLDQIQAFDTDMYNVNINAAGFYLDRDWSGVGNTENVATDLSTTVAVSITGTEIRYFAKFNIGAIAAGTLGLCNFAARDRDTGTSLIRHFFGTTVNALVNANEFGLCEFSGTDVAASGGGGDVTAPVVSSCTAENVTSSSFTAQCTSDEAGTATLKRDTDNDNAVDGADMVTVNGGSVGAATFTIAVTGLTASQLYEWKVEVQDAAGNVGTGAIVDTTTSAPTATLFVANAAAGSGNCSSAGNACLFSTVWASAVPGSIIEATAGTYQGANSMIRPTCTGCGSINGTAANPITVRCATDGACLIDGQGARQPIRLENNDWFVIDGFNAKDSNGAVVLLTTGADNNIVRRVCAWDADGSTNSHVFSVTGNTGNVLEDVCGFGIGRKIFSFAQGGNNSILRRAWGIWEQHNVGTGPQVPIQCCYNSTNNAYENVIATTRWTGTGSTNWFGSAGLDIGSEGANHSVKGSLFYLRSGDNVQQGNMIMTQWNAGANVPITFTDVTLYSGLASKRPFALASQSCVGCALTNITEVGGIASSIGAAWTITNRSDTDTIAAMDSAGANPFQTSAGTGARMCYRYVNGTLTTEKLWPWLMDSRINAALTAAGKNPSDYLAGAGNTVTSQVENILGVIPAECKN